MNCLFKEGSLVKRLWMKIASHTGKHSKYKRWGRSRFIVDPMESNKINNNIEINSMFHVLATVTLLLTHAVFTDIP